MRDLFRPELGELHQVAVHSLPEPAAVIEHSLPELSACCFQL